MRNEPILSPTLARVSVDDALDAVVTDYELTRALRPRAECARGRMITSFVEFEDGYRVTTSRLNVRDLMGAVRGPDASLRETSGGPRSSRRTARAVQNAPTAKARERT